ncbi:armadillo-type fold-containing protein [Anabaena sp. FACHB-1237]|uniref:armadillo-type fold-containing protein n=1 Tax=Anabaena sp. FACHB-1237 TaxID=2692769 RepID=UPI00167FE5BE|nr:armadillo-type fold-containing protein [Anabaena sp. FACHB-1237]MBD2138900.1 armadillo-type fold-containing protein [Anabaena sp. FACHB-1237]
MMNKLPHIKTVSSKKLIFTTFSEPGFVLGLLTIIVAMLVWNWQLLLSLVIGITVMLLSYSWQQWNWQLWWSELRRSLNGTNARLFLAIVSGALVTFITYMIGHIWVDSPSHWLATATIIQGMTTLLTLVLLLWQIFQLQLNQEQDNIDQLLDKLTSGEPLKRLLALRKLNKHLLSQDATVNSKKDIGKCLQLLLKQEKEAIIREAVLDCLQNVDEFKVISANSQEVLIPISLKKRKVLVD